VSPCLQVEKCLDPYGACSGGIATWAAGMGRPCEFTRSELELLRWLRAHEPAGTGQTAAAVGEPTTNYGRQRLGRWRRNPAACASTV
jgi:hypothetical protein